MSVEARPGYQQTELGEIPSDWVVMPFGKIFAFSNGVNADKKSYGKGFRFINVLEPITYSHLYGPEILGRVAVSDAVAAAYVVRKGDVLFNRTSETDVELGLAATYLGTEHVVFGGFVIKGHPTDDSFDPRYSGYAMRAPFIRSQIIPLGQGVVRANIGQNSLRLVICPVPPLHEQQAIAEALSDVDTLLELLKQLVAKKRYLKQAAMQELLTAKKRLPGFYGEWHKFTIDKIVKTPVTDGPHLTPKFLDDGIPFLSVNNLVGNKIDFTDLRYISNTDHEEFSKKCRPKKNDVLLGKAASVGKVAIVDVDIEFNIWSPIALVRVNTDHEPRFVYYQLQSADLNKQIALLTNSSSQGNIGMGDIERLVLSLPEKPEQAAIVAVLSDMDSELAELETQLTKTRTLKQGMMHKLLTGEIRLL